MDKDSFLTLPSHRPLILDGAMGTMLRQSIESLYRIDFSKAAGLSIQWQECCDLLSLSAPEIVASIHNDYLEAGADIISTNTFNSNPENLLIGREMAQEINKAATELALSCANEFCRSHKRSDANCPKVAGSIGPGHPSFTADSFLAQASRLIETGVDILLLETCYDFSLLQTALSGINKAFYKTGRKIPLIVSATINASGCLPDGTSLEAFAECAEYGGADCIGLNCSLGPGALIGSLRKLHRISSLPLSVHPNAGLPDSSGRYPLSPQEMAESLAPLIDDGIIKIVGGCCGTTPDHIRRLAQLSR